jgi:hypothetical protein
MLQKKVWINNIFLILTNIVLLLQFTGSFKSPIILDSGYDKLTSLHRLHLFYPEIESNHQYSSNIVHINEVINSFELSGKRDFFNETSYFLKNHSKMTNHGPVFYILSKLPGIRSLGIWGFRLLNFVFFILGLFFFYFSLKELAFKEKTCQFIIFISTVSIFSYNILQHGRVYSLGFLINTILGFLFLKLLKAKKDKNIFGFQVLILICIHLGFLNYYFFAIYIPIIILGFSVYSYFFHEELKINLDNYFRKIFVVLVSYLSLGFYFELIQSSMNHNFSSWIKNSSANLLETKLYNLLQTYSSLISNHYIKVSSGIGLIFLAILIFLSIKHQFFKKAFGFYLIYLLIPLSLLILDFAFSLKISSKIRYSFACLPAIFIIYGLCFEKRPKLILGLIIFFFSLPFIVPQLKTKKTLHATQYEYINTAKTIKLKNLNSKVLIINSAKLIEKIVFAKYFIENLEHQPAIFDQESKKKIYITTKDNLSFEQILQFIKTNNINEVVLLSNRKYSNYYSLLLSELKKSSSEIKNLTFQLIKIDNV